MPYNACRERLAFVSWGKMKRLPLAFFVEFSYEIIKIVGDILSFRQAFAVFLLFEYFIVFNNFFCCASGSIGMRLKCL